jgi:hypothetical protein
MLRRGRLTRKYLLSVRKKVIAAPLRGRWRLEEEVRIKKRISSNVDLCELQY